MDIEAVRRQVQPWLLRYASTVSKSQAELTYDLIEEMGTQLAAAQAEVARLKVDKEFLRLNRNDWCQELDREKAQLATLRAAIAEAVRRSEALTQRSILFAVAVAIETITEPLRNLDQPEGEGKADSWADRHLPDYHPPVWQQRSTRPEGEGKAPTFRIGDRVEKVRGSNWRGTVCGTYSTSITPEGYAVESAMEPGNVQIYPVAALKAWDQPEGEDALVEARKDVAALREALDAEDAHWAASRALACALTRLRPQAEDVMAAASKRRDIARKALASRGLVRGEGV